MNSDFKRPRPSLHLLGIEGVVAEPSFEPAPDLLAWLTATFIDEGAPLNNPDHAHLAMAHLGVLWTNVPNSRHGRRIVGQAEFKPPSSAMGKWARARAECQIVQWFGGLPDFMLTFDAEYAASCSDAEWCALVEHELMHCGQARDEYGAPRFAKSGLPVFEARGHDIEEFVGVVRRYGADAAHARAFADAMALSPDVRPEAIARVCGTCGG